MPLNIPLAPAAQVHGPGCTIIPDDKARSPLRSLLFLRLLQQPAYNDQLSMLGGCLGTSVWDEGVFKELGCCVMTNDVRAMLDLLQCVCESGSKCVHAVGHVTS